VNPTVIVPTVNGSERLGQLLETLDPNAYEVLVVDNGSTDGTDRMLAARFPAVRVLRRETNEGFSRAVNLGARSAEGDVLVLLNDDCVCDPDFVPALAGALDPSTGVVMAAAVLRRWLDAHRIESAGMEIDHTLLVWEHLHGEPIQVLDSDVPNPIGPSAAAAALHREAFLAIGGFDERLFAYWEDVDLVLRLRVEGGTCVLAHGARGAHKHAATLGAGSPRKNYLMGFGRAYVLRKWQVATLQRLPAILAREVPICAGQMIFDRNLSSVHGRVRGFRAAADVPRLPYPGDVLAGRDAAGALTTLRRRARRRVRPREQARRAA
jgi:GT2 family glycosyltransferase